MRGRAVAMWIGIAGIAAAALVPGLAGAQGGGVDAGAGAAAGSGSGTGTGSGTGDAGVGGEVGGCVESIPKGAMRPVVSEAFPMRGISGWAATLAITVRHGKGERVLPAGLDLSSAQEAKKYLQKSGFAIPDQDGGAAAHLWTEPEDKDKSYSVTHLDLPLVLLPPGPGRNVMQLPPMPVAVARANGEIATVCTYPHSIAVEDPTANAPHAEPKQNPPPRPQREEWTALKKALLWGGLGLLLGALLAYLAYRQLTKPKPPTPPPPPRPPWEIALEELDEVRHAGLLDAQRHGEYFDRVSDAVRGYLGARFGFDGLESTSDEILTALRRHGAGFVRLERTPAAATQPSTEREAPAIAAPTPGIPLEDIRRFLAECDLVKFANLLPSPAQCTDALTSGERIVRTTMPFSPSAADRPTPHVPVPVPVAESPTAEPRPPASDPPTSDGSSSP